MIDLEQARQRNEERRAQRMYGCSCCDGCQAAPDIDALIAELGNIRRDAVDHVNRRCSCWTTPRVCTDPCEYSLLTYFVKTEPGGATR